MSHYYKEKYKFNSLNSRKWPQPYGSLNPNNNGYSTIWLCSCLYKVNLAYGKPTWHTAGKHTSDNAVDGRYANRSETGNQCALSFASEEVTWLVDLEAICSINTIVLYHRVEGTQFGEWIIWFCCFFFKCDLFFSISNY